VLGLKQPIPDRKRGKEARTCNISHRPVRASFLQACLAAALSLTEDLVLLSKLCESLSLGEIVLDGLLPRLVLDNHTTTTTAAIATQGQRNKYS
jgi:hypothetical protein